MLFLPASSQLRFDQADGARAMQLHVMFCLAKKHGAIAVGTTGEAWGRMYEEQVSPLLAFIFYPPYNFLSKLTCVKGIQDYQVGPNAFRFILSFLHL